MKPFLTIKAHIHILTVNILHNITRHRIINTKKQAFTNSFRPYPLWRKPVMAIILVFILLIPIETEATCIIVRRTPHEIVIGVDSLITNTIIRNVDGKKQKTITNSYMCKITQVGSTFFAATGYVGSPNLGVLDIEGIGIQACKQSRSIKESANTFFDMMAGSFVLSLERLRQADIEEYRSTTSGMPALQVLFVGIENAIPVLVYKGFQTTNLESEPVKVEPANASCPGTFPKTSIITVLAGEYEQIKGYDKNEPFWRKNGGVTGIRILIERMKKNSPKVGGEINILRITRNHAQWMPKQSQCPAIEEYWKHQVPAKPKQQKPKNSPKRISK